MYDEGRASTIYKAVGLRIRTKRRDTLKITQLQLSKLTGGRLTRSAIANIESGRQRIAVHHLYELATVIGCEPGDLLPQREEIFSPPENLVVSVERDPAAIEFTRRIFGVNELDEIARTPAQGGRKK